MDSIADKIESINSYLLNSNCSDFRVKHFDGSNLHLIGSFDLCYYHNIEIVFHEVFRLALNTSFDLGLLQSPFQFNIVDIGNDKMVEVIIVDNSNAKQSVICEHMDFIVKTVKYYDEAGKRIV